MSERDWGGADLGDRENHSKRNSTPSDSGGKEERHTGVKSATRVCAQRRQMGEDRDGQPGSIGVLMESVDLGWARHVGAFGEVWVDASLLGRNPTSGVVHEQRVQEVQSIIVESGHDGCNVGPMPLGERRLEVGEGSHAGPLALRGGTQDAVVARLVEIQKKGVGKGVDVASC